MCGYVGYYSKEKYDQAIIKSMADTITHRGPDSDGYYESKGINFGFRRLSIIDLAEGTQPISSEDETKLIMFNGEIYNYKDIRVDLEEKGYVFKTHTDTEVILHSYQEYGPEGCLNKLRGMFSFVIWDDKNEVLFGARDHFGIKPHYYCELDGEFLFGSEIKSFLKFPNFKKEINKDALKNYLIFQYNPLEETFFKGVKKLRPGHYYTYKNGELTISKYFDLKLEYNKNMTLEESIDKIEKVVENSIEYHKISDVEVGSFLSGGVDSSYVVAKANVDKTFSVGFENNGFNETMYAKELSDMLNINNYSKLISADEFFEGVKKTQYHSDEPHANLSSVPLYYLSKLAREQVKVVLSGEGADELFGGYDEYMEAPIHKLYKKIPFVLRNKIFKLTKSMDHFKGKMIVTKYGEKVEDNYIGLANIMNDEESNSLLAPAYRNTLSAKDITRKFYRNVSDMDDISKQMYLDMHLWIVEDILLKADKMTMANSIELRVPLLDKEVWNVARTIPVEQKIHNGITKYAFRQAAKRAIPEEWYNRKKLGFTVPFREFIKEEKYYKQVKDMFNKEYTKEFFDVEKINKLLDDHYNKVTNNGRKIYTIYSFLVWYEIYFVN